MHQALLELGKLRFGEMGVEDGIREVVQTTHTMFDVDGAGLMLADADRHLRKVAASDDRFAHLEELQIQHDEGPCSTRTRARSWSAPRTWPGTAAGRCSGERRSGGRRAPSWPARCPTTRTPSAWSRCCPRTGRPWSPEGELALLAFTDLAALLIASMMQGEEQSGLALQLQGALDSRQIIEQAKGVLMGGRGAWPRGPPMNSCGRGRGPSAASSAVVCAESGGQASGTLAAARPGLRPARGAAY